MICFMSTLIDIESSPVTSKETREATLPPHFPFILCLLDEENSGVKSSALRKNDLSVGSGESNIEFKDR